MKKANGTRSVAQARVSVVGAGQVGGAIAQRLAEKNLAQVYLLDVIKGLAAGKALDLMQAAPLEGYTVRVEGGDDPSGMAGSGVVVVTAGVTRKPGMSRDDLLKVNARIVNEIGAHIRRNAPDAVVIAVTNPLDVMAYLLLRETGFERRRVMGMAGVLDSARFSYFVAEKLGVAPSDVHATVLGSHGDLMVPIPRCCTVRGIALTELLSNEQIIKCVERTRNAGAEIVALLQTGSAFYAPSAAAVAMIRAILRNESRLTTASVMLEGEYGIRGVPLGVPVRLGGTGVKKVIELDLTAEEKAALARSAQHIRESIDSLEKPGKQQKV